MLCLRLITYGHLGQWFESIRPFLDHMTRTFFLN